MSSRLYVWIYPSTLLLNYTLYSGHLFAIHGSKMSDFAVTRTYNNMHMTIQCTYIQGVVRKSQFFKKNCIKYKSSVVHFVLLVSLRSLRDLKLIARDFSYLWHCVTRFKIVDYSFWTISPRELLFLDLKSLNHDLLNELSHKTTTHTFSFNILKTSPPCIFAEYLLNSQETRYPPSTVTRNQNYNAFNLQLMQSMGPKRHFWDTLYEHIS